MPGPAVLERLHWQAGNVGRAGDVHATTVGQADSVAGGVGPSDRKVPRRGKGASRTTADSDLPVQPQGEEGRHRQRFPQAARSARSDRLHRSGPGEGAGLQRKEGQRAVRVQPRQGRSTSTTTTSTLTMRTSGPYSSRCAATRHGESNYV